MSHQPQLWIFFLIVLGVIALPGLDMAFVFGSTLVGGRRAGLAAVAGIVAGGICHTTAGATGASVLLTASPLVFNAVLLAGAAWVAWVGVSLLRSKPAPAPSAAPSATTRATTSATTSATAVAPPPRTLPATFRQGAVTCLLNPKAYVFMLAVFPHFLSRESGAIAVQAAVLGAIIAGTQIAVYGSLAVAAGGAGRWLEERPAAQAYVSRCTGAVLLSFSGLSVVQAFGHGLH